MTSMFRNNTGNKTKQDLIDGFVVRTKPFKRIFEELSASNSDKPEQNYIIIGQRGAGKTTLLYRLKYAVEDILLPKWGIIPVMFSEEQYNLSDLIDLWEYVGELLEEQGHLNGISGKLATLWSTKTQEENAFYLLEDELKKAQKKLIIFIENIDAFFKKIGTSGQKRLREVLISSNRIRLIASATTYFDGIMDYNMPFYEFFKIIELKGLNRDESRDLLIKIGEQYGQKDKIENVIRKNPKRLESLRRLTGGVPRTISYLFEIFLDNENGKAIKDLYKLIDDLTFLYKSELDQLSAQQQKIIDVIAKHWDAIPVKDISLKTRFESKQVSSILQALEKNQTIEKVATRSKNNLYRVRERFMNIWYLMRFGKEQDKENVIWLVRFYDAWCDKTELANHINKHLQNISTGKYDLKAALYMGNAFLACENVPIDLKYSIYQQTKKVWPKKSIEALQYSDKDLYETISERIKKKKYEEALDILLNEVTEKNENYYMFSSFIYEMNEDYVNAEDSAEKYNKLVPSSGIGALRVGIINDLRLNNPEKAILYYNQALDLKEYNAAYHLGNLFYRNENEENALEYYLIAARNGIKESFMRVADIYFHQHKLELAAEFCQKAIKAGNQRAFINLGAIEEMNGDFEKATNYYKKALEKGIDDALLFLSQVEMMKMDANVDFAIDYATRAQIKKVKGAAVFLAKIYLDIPEKVDAGLKMLRAEAANGNSSAAHVLGHHYSDDNNFEESDFYFEKAVELGLKSSFVCHANAIYEKIRTDKRRYALALFDTNKEAFRKMGGVAKMEYACILLWNDEVEQSKEIFSTQMASLSKIYEDNLDKFAEHILSEATSYMTLMLAKGLFNVASSLFTDMSTIDLKNVMKPVYFALMNYMKTEYPKEFLKAGDELKETVHEIIDQVESLRKRLKQADVENLITN